MAGRMSFAWTIWTYEKQWLVKLQLEPSWLVLALGRVAIRSLRFPKQS
jgi:hypothetical protein